MILSTSTGRSVASERYRFESMILGAVGPLDLHLLGDSYEYCCFYIGRDSGLRSHVQINSFFVTENQRFTVFAKKVAMAIMSIFSKSRSSFVQLNTLIDVRKLWVNSCVNSVSTYDLRADIPCILSGQWQKTSMSHISGITGSSTPNLQGYVKVAAQTASTKSFFVEF